MKILKMARLERVKSNVHNGEKAFLHQLNKFGNTSKCYRMSYIRKILKSLKDVGWLF